ncbi:hypothetical protein GCM10020219_000300 [Nonomuraea dietziae]
MTARENASTLPEVDALTYGMATYRGSPLASGTATASTAPSDPSRGYRSNPAKLLLDPYAKAIEV